MSPLASEEKGKNIDEPLVEETIEVKTTDIIGDDEEEFIDEYPDYFPKEVIDELKESGAVGILKRREDIRGQLALIYTLATFLMFLLGFLVAVLDAYWRNTSVIENLSQILPLISGIFLGSLGFVLGYYFRRLEDNN